MGIIVGKVLDSIKHPYADYLYIALIDVGNTEPRYIIYGGKKVLVSGELVPVALPGSYLPSGVKIRKRNYRGIASDGMLCSIVECGLSLTGPDEVHVLIGDYKSGDRLS